MKRNLPLLFLAIVFVLSLGQIAVASHSKDMKSSPNYLVILVHGIGAHTDTFTGTYGDLKSYLENNLGLEGYVYLYNFTDPLQSSIKSAYEHKRIDPLCACENKGQP